MEQFGMFRRIKITTSLFFVTSTQTKSQQTYGTRMEYGDDALYK